jgi:hypothetical protein
MYKFHTGLSKLRASSPAKSRPPFAQIYVINLLLMLCASLGMSTKSIEIRLKVGLLTIFLCVQPAFRNAAAVPREASRAQKSPCPAITSSSASTSPSMCSKVIDMFSDEGVNFSALAPTELKTIFNRCTQRLPKPRHMFRSSFKDCCNFVFSTASASYFVCKFFLSCSKLSDFWRSSLFNLAFSVCASAREPSIAWSRKSFCQRFDPGESLDRRVNCRRVSQPRWVGARRSAKGGKGRQEKGETRSLRVVLRPGRVRLQ